MYEFSKTIFFPFFLLTSALRRNYFRPKQGLTHERVKQLSSLRPLVARNSFKIYADDMTCLEEVTDWSLI